MTNFDSAIGCLARAQAALTEKETAAYGRAGSIAQEVLGTIRNSLISIYLSGFKIPLIQIFPKVTDTLHRLLGRFAPPILYTFLAVNCCSENQPPLFLAI